MKLKSLRIRNFRSYNSEITIDIDNLTVFVGKNDIGKSTILEALDIFFNDKNAVIKLDENDFNKSNFKSGDDEIIIAATFTDLPDVSTPSIAYA
jgi:predicted ATP-dependent endonuclease of OLD family